MESSGFISEIIVCKLCVGEKDEKETQILEDEFQGHTFNGLGFRHTLSLFGANTH